MSILTSEQQATARELDRFSALHGLLLQVTKLEKSLRAFESAAPDEPAVSERDLIRAIAIAAEQVELAIWFDDTRTWALADTIRLRAAMLWDEWKAAEGELRLSLAQERAIPISRQIRAIARLCELLQIEMGRQTEFGEPRSLLRSA
jgi:hypothetical protein